MGDFNINILNCENDKNNSEFTDLMYVSGLGMTREQKPVPMLSAMQIKKKKA